MVDGDQSDDRPSTFADAVYPIQLMFESDGLFYYSAHCCDTENSHWGVLTSSSDKLSTGCPGTFVPGTRLNGTWQLLADAIRSVYACDDISSPNPDNGLQLINASAERIKGDFRVTQGVANPPRELDQFCQRLAGVMFDLYRVDYKYTGGTCPPDAKFQFIFACNPREIAGRVQDLPLKAVKTVPGIAYCQSQGFDSDHLVMSLKSF